MGVSDAIWPLDESTSVAFIVRISSAGESEPYCEGVVDDDKPMTAFWKAARLCRHDVTSMFGTALRGLRLGRLARPCKVRNRLEVDLRGIGTSSATASPE